MPQEGNTLTLTYTHRFPTLVDEDLKIKVFDATLRPNFMIADQVATDGRSAADYIYNAGPIDNVVKLFDSRVKNAKANSVTNGIGLSSLVQITNTDSGEIWVPQIFCNINWGIIGPYTLGTTQPYMDLVSAAFGLTHKGLTAANGYPTLTVMDAFERSVLSGFNV
jgi:hypothetical protein